LVFLESLDLNFADYGVKMKKLPVKPLPKVMHNHMSAPAPLNQVRKDFEKVGDSRRYGQRFSLTDVLMSGLAVFSLKFPSLLKFDEKRKEARIRANLQSLFGVKRAPGDTQLRAVCDQVNPAEIRAPFIHINRRLYDHRLLENFRYLDGFLVSIDGTGQFASSSIRCPQCCRRHHRNGQIGYYHQ
jgi:hypothetical protein